MMVRCIGFANEATGEEYVTFTEDSKEETPTEEFVKPGCKVIYEEEIDDFSCSFPMDRRLKVDA
jgi:hypothetical protein